jgi:hypothetical protein
MKSLIKILFRVVVCEFYKINSGFFFLIFCLLIATVHNPEQLFTYSFLSKIAQSEIFLLLFLFVVAFYARKCQVFFVRCIADIRNGFFYYLTLADRSRSLIAMSMTFIMLLSPLAIYSLLLIIVAVSIKEWHVVLAVPLFFLFLIYYLATFVLKRISYTIEEYKGGFRMNPFGSSRFYYWYFINFFLNRMKLVFISTKILSVLILIGMMNLYFTDEYPMILIYLGVLVSMMFHFVLIFELRKFEEEYLMILRNLPIRSTVFIVYLITYFLMSLPELVVLSLYPLKIHSDALFIPPLGVSILLSLHVISYFSSMRMRLFFRNTLIFFVASFFALLFNTPAIVLIIANFAIAYGLFYTQYFSYETTTR